MRRLALLAVVASLSLSSFAQDREPLTEQGARDMRQMLGFPDVGSDADSDVFAYREEGKFLISKQAFASRKEAVKFCESKPGYHLTEGMLPGVLIMSSLPFESLRKHMIVDAEVIGRSGTRSGVVTWVTFDLSKIPADYKPRFEEAPVFEMLKGGEYYLSFTNGDGGSGGGFESTAGLNERLKAAGLPAIKMPAICVDEQLRSVDAWIK